MQHTILIPQKVSFHIILTDLRIKPMLEKCQVNTCMALRTWMLTHTTKSSNLGMTKSAELPKLVRVRLPSNPHPFHHSSASPSSASWSQNLSNAWKTKEIHENPCPPACSIRAKVCYRGASPLPQGFSGSPTFWASWSQNLSNAWKTEEIHENPCNPCKSMKI